MKFNRNGIPVIGSWNAKQKKYLFTAGINKKAAAFAELKLIFDNCNYAEKLGIDENGVVFLKNEDIESSIVSEPDCRRGVLLQTVKVKAKKEGVLKGRYIITLYLHKEGKIFLPAFWSYLGKMAKLNRIETHYPSYGYCNQVRTSAVSVEKSQKGTSAVPAGNAQLRTPAVCVEQGDNSVTAASLGPHPVHISIEKGREGLRFIVYLDRPVLGPDGYQANPKLSAGEELTAQFYIDIAKGDWQTGMKRWMDYNMANVIKDKDIPPAWTRKVRMFWCKWDKINKRDIDEIAGLGVEMVEVHPFTAPGAGVIEYAHKKGLKILLEHYLLSYYKPARLTYLNLSPGMDDPHIARACLAVAAKHPDWCVRKQDGKIWGISDKQNWAYIHMDPNVKAFREAKVKEAVDAVKKGYDGIRYDNALYLNCFSRDHRHIMTYEHAVSMMLKEIRQAVRLVNPQAVIFINNGGPDLYSVADIHMYEGGLSDENFIRKGTGGENQRGSSYSGAHNRMMTAKVLWGFTGKRYCIHDYPVNLKKGEPAFWRSAIFTVMHDGICSFGGAIENKEGSRLPEYRIASSIFASIEEPLTEIINDKNIAYRLYAPGTILILETEGKRWSGVIKGLDLPLEREQEYKLFSLSGKKVCRVAKGKDFHKGIEVELAADGSDVLQFLK